MCYWWRNFSFATWELDVSHDTKLSVTTVLVYLILPGIAQSSHALMSLGQLLKNDLSLPEARHCQSWGICPSGQKNFSCCMIQNMSVWKRWIWFNRVKTFKTTSALATPVLGSLGDYAWCINPLMHWLCSVSDVTFAPCHWFCWNEPEVENHPESAGTHGAVVSSVRTVFDVRPRASGCAGSGCNSAKTSVQVGSTVARIISLVWVEIEL